MATLTIRPTDDIKGNIWYSDFNKFVKEHYGLEYNALEGFEVKNNDTYELWTINEDWGDSYYQKTVREWKNGEGGDPHPAALMWDLVQQGILEEGRYLFEVMW